jgi:hypothetical protein
VSSPLDRQAPCPSCGATITFQFAGAKAIVCKYCKALVARTDRSLTTIGKVADLLEIASPLSLHATGRWGGKRFEVEGRVQLDRVGAPSAPWQEFFIGFPETGEGCWVANAQGRWYSTREMSPAPALPPWSSLRPGAAVSFPGMPPLAVVEVGKRKVVSAEGELPNVAMPGAATAFVDVSGPNGVFGTLDYGSDDPQAPIPPAIYMGGQFDPATFVLDSGQPLAAPEAQVAACECPTCGGALPLAAPGTAERIVCKYCGTVSDVRRGGALQALGRAPKPPMEPFVPIGAQGNLRNLRVTCVGFVIRGCTVEGIRYHWREYLLYAGASAGYVWLMEEDGSWKFVTPLAAGDVQTVQRGVVYRMARYMWKQHVQAQVEHVVGEFYWKVEIGESVSATDYQGSNGIVSVEQTDTEVTHSFCAPMSRQEVATAFGLAAPPMNFQFGGGGGGGGSSASPKLVWVIVVVVIVLIVLAANCDGGSSGGGSSGVYVGPGFGGK